MKILRSSRCDHVEIVSCNDTLWEVGEDIAKIITLTLKRIVFFFFFLVVISKRNSNISDESFYKLPTKHF